jgi:hypothetical protein
MAKRRSPKSRPTKAGRGLRGKTGATGPAGSIGPMGPAGPAGPAGVDHSKQISAIAEQLAELAQQLRTQLVRIAQIQAQLDHLTGVGPLQPHERLTVDRNDN